MMISEVEFRLAGGAQPLILLPASVNGAEEREFILDTGAGTTLLTKELAALAGVRATGSVEGMGAAGPITIETGQADSLRVAGFTVHQTPVAITDGILRIGSAIGAAVQGTLGYSFLKDFRMTLDYRLHRLTLDTRRRPP